MESKYPEKYSDLIKGIKSQIILTVVLATLGSLSLVIVPIAVTKAVGAFTYGDTDVFFLWVIITVAGIILRQLLHMGSTGYAHLVEAKFRYELRKDFSVKLTHLPLGWFTKFSSGEIRKLISGDIIKIHTIIAHAYSDATSAIVVPISCIVVMLIFEWKTALMIIGVTLFVLFIAMILMGVGSKESQTINQDYGVAQGEMSGAAVEIVDGIKEIKNFGLVDSVFKRFDTAVNTFSEVSYKWLSGFSKAMSFLTAAIQPAVMSIFVMAICLFSLSKKSFYFYFVALQSHLLL